MKRLLSCLCLLWATWALAQPAFVKTSEEVPEHISAERERLQHEREAVGLRHDERMRECWQRFAVNNCLREVRRSRYAGLDPIRARELELNTQERAWRTRQRAERLKEKTSKAEENARPSEPASGEQRKP